MNSASDHGYVMGNPVEDRTVRRCVSAACWCRMNGHRDWAKAWISEGKMRRQRDCHQAQFEARWSNQLEAYYHGR